MSTKFRLNENTENGSYTADLITSNEMMSKSMG